MPTTRPRHSVTETDEVAAALRAAAQRWPEDRDSASRLLLRLVREGYRVISHDLAAERTKREAGVEASAGALTGVYAEGYLADLRSDWAE